MNTRNISKHIKSKMDSWLASIEDRQLAQDLKPVIMVTGGCLASLLTNDKVNDYDVYLTDFGMAVRLSEYYVGKFNAMYNEHVTVRVSDDNRVTFHVQSQGIAGPKAEDDPAYKYFEAMPEDQAGEFVDTLVRHVNETKEAARDEKNLYLPVFLTTNAVTLTDKVQVVTRFQGTPEEIHKNFDFLHCMGYWTYADNQVVVTVPALLSLMNKQLVFQGSLYPIAALLRVRKFMARGWTISAGQVLKMCYAVNALDLKDPAVLREQLVGMDFAYFRQLIDALMTPDGQVRANLDAMYVCEVIDRMEGGGAA